MKASTAIHHGEYVRTCYMPKLLPASVFAQFAADIRVLYGILAKVMQAYYRDAAYRALFGFDAVTEELILRADPSRTLLPMARIDFFYNEETGAYQYCEFNTDGTSAMNEDRELNLAQQRSTVYKGFCAAHTYPHLRAVRQLGAYAARHLRPRARRAAAVCGHRGFSGLRHRQRV